MVDKPDGWQWCRRWWVWVSPACRSWRWSRWRTGRREPRAPELARPNWNRVTNEYIWNEYTRGHWPHRPEVTLPVEIALIDLRTASSRHSVISVYHFCYLTNFPRKKKIPEALHWPAYPYWNAGTLQVSCYKSASRRSIGPLTISCNRIESFLYLSPQMPHFPPLRPNWTPNPPQ